LLISCSTTSVNLSVLFVLLLRSVLWPVLLTLIVALVWCTEWKDIHGLQQLQPAGWVGGYAVDRWPVVGSAAWYRISLSHFA